MELGSSKLKVPSWILVLPFEGTLTDLVPAYLKVDLAG